MRRAVLLTVLTLAVAACGGSDEDTGTTTTTPDVPDGAVTTTAAAQPGEPGVATAGTRVSVDYTGTLSDGTEFDTSIGKEPIQFTVGAGEMIAGFDAAVEGMTVGETKTITIPSGEAYGERSDDMIIEVPIDQVPEGIAAGDELVSPVGQVVVVLEVGEEFVTIDTNHQLAGESLIFEITLVSVDG